MSDEIIIPFSADVASYEKAIDDVEKRTLGLADAANTADKAFNKIGKDVAKGADKALKSTNQELKQTTTEANKASKALKETTGTSGFLKLRNELKAVKGQMADLVVSGKEGSAEFKKLQIQAGALQDQMKDLGTSIAQNAGDPLENLSGTVGSLQGSFTSLDFDGVSRGLSSLATNVGRVDLKTFKDGLSGVVGGFGKLAGAILTNPLFLVAGAVTAIVAAVMTWGESLEEIRAKNDRLIAGIDRRLSIVQTGYEAEIIKLRASGKETDEQEKKKLKAVINATERKIKLRQKEFEYEVKNADTIARILGDKKTQEIIDASETNKTITDLSNELTLAKAEFAAIDLENEKEKNDKIAEAAKKASEDYKKVLEDRQKKIIDKANADFAASVFKAQQDEAQTLTDGHKKIDAIVDEANGVKKEKARTLEDDLREIRRENLRHIFNDEKKSYEERLAALTEANDQALISEEEYNKESYQLSIDRIDQKNAEFQLIVSIANNVNNIGKAINTLASENAEDAAERDKLFTAFGIGLSLASSLADTIAGATKAAKAGGVAAPFLLAAYITSGLATVLGAFAQVKTLLNAPVPKAAAQGEEWVQGRQYGKDTEHYMLAHGERVVTSAVNNKYWDELHAMHTGRYDKYVNEKRILPALRKVLGSKAEFENESFASNIANSIMMNKDNWKGNNIVGALVRVNESEERRHKELVNAMKPRTARRKK
jgi:hypothetical protein